MNHTQKLGIFLAALTIGACENDDDQLPPSPVAPTVTLISPADGAENIDIAPNFTWSAQSEASDALAYEFYIGEDSLNVTLEGENLSTPEFKLENFKLKKGVNYVWRVVANNGEASGTSNTFGFLTLPAPSSTQLMGPDEASNVRTIAPLAWSSVEAGEDEVLTYEVLVGPENPPTEVVAEISETSFDYDTSDLISGQTYYWQVRVSDKINKSESEVKSFVKLSPGAPDQPVLTSPLNRAGIKGDVAILEWSAVEDPEGDEVSYNVYIGAVDPPATLVATVQTNSYTTEILDKNSAFYWRVEAADPNTNSSQSTTNRSFQLLNAGGPESPILNDLEVDRILSLDESLSWADAEGAVAYDVYIDEVFPPVKIVAENSTATEYLVKNEDIPSVLTDVKTYYAQIVAKDAEGAETRSVELIFEPQMQGVFTDIRAEETETYTWLRLNTQVWMTQNLRTKKTSTGIDLVNVAQGALEATDPAYDEMPASVLGVNGFPNISQEDWVSKNGRLYNRPVIDQNLLAPDGWRVMSVNDVNTLFNFVIEDQGNPNNVTGRLREKIVVEAITSPLYNGTDLYGLNFESAGWRSGDVATSREGLLLVRNFYSLENPGNFLELWNLPDASNDGRFRTFEWGAAALQMSGVRLIKE